MAEEFLTGAAAVGAARLAAELLDITALAKAHGEPPLIGRCSSFRPGGAADVRSILGAGTGVSVVTPPGADLVLMLPSLPPRSLAHYAIHIAAAAGGQGSAS